MKWLRSLFSVLLVGHELSKPGAWKNAQLWASLLIALFGVAEAFGFIINVSEDATLGFAVTVLGLVNAFVTVATTKKIGLPTRELPPIDLVSTPTPGRVRESVPAEFDPKIDGRGFGDK